MLEFLMALLPKSLQKVSSELSPETMSELGEDLSQVNDSLATATERENTLQAQVTDLQAQVSTLEGQLAQVTAEKETLATDLQSANQKAANLQVLIDDFQWKAKDGGNADTTSLGVSQLTYSQKLLSKTYGISI